MQLKYLLYFSIAILSGLLSQAALANPCVAVDRTVNITPLTMTVQRDTPLYAPIGSEFTSRLISSFKCEASAVLKYQELGIYSTGSYVTTIDKRRVYSTGFPGIGYALGASTYLNNCTGYVQYVDGIYTIGGNVNIRRLCQNEAGRLESDGSLSLTVSVQFYKIAGTINSGRIPSQQLGGLVLRNDQATWVQPAPFINLASFNVITASCRVNTPVISVPMGRVDKSEFRGEGTSPGDTHTKNFTIPLSCTAGTRVNIRIESSNYNATNAAKGVLALSSDSSASGVGVQLLSDKNVPVELSKNTFYGTSAGLYDIPLKARYYQTNSTVKAGTANATATLTLVFQ